MALDNSSTARDAAICNFIQTVRSTKTAEGFGSNYGAAGSKSVDRTEPPQAARVLSVLYEKFNATYEDSFGAGLNWLVELVFQDLLESVFAKRPAVSTCSLSVWLHVPLVDTELTRRMGFSQLAPVVSACEGAPNRPAAERQDGAGHLPGLECCCRLPRLRTRRCTRRANGKWAGQQSNVPAPFNISENTQRRTVRFVSNNSRGLCIHPVRSRYDCKGKSGVCDGTECPTCDVLFNYSTGQMQLIDVGMVRYMILWSRSTRYSPVV